MNISIRSILLALGGLALLCLHSGCLATTSTASQRRAGEQEDIAILNEKIRRLDGDIETLNLQMEQLRMELRRMQDQEASSSRQQYQQIEASMAALEKQFLQLEADRQADRREIVDTLSKKIAEVINTQAVGPPTRSTTPAASGYGYEHVVQSGETLSRIAQAYDTTMRRIIEANNLQNPDALRVGQTLFIPE